METLTIAREPWGVEVEALLGGAVHDPLVGVETVKLIVTSGAGGLFVTRHEGRLVFAYVVTINDCEGGSEAVVVASAGVAVAGMSLARRVIPDLEKRFGFCDRIRMTASRKGMEKILNGLGYQRQAVVYIKQGAAHVF